MSLIYCDVSAECKYRLWMTSCLINAHSTDCLTCMNFVKGYTLSSSGQTCEFCSSITLQHEALMHWAITRCLGPRGLNSHSLRRWRSPSEISPCRIPFTVKGAGQHARTLWAGGGDTPGAFPTNSQELYLLIRFRSGAQGRLDVLIPAKSTYSFQHVGTRLMMPPSAPKREPESRRAVTSLNAFILEMLLMPLLEVNRDIKKTGMRYVYFFVVCDPVLVCGLSLISFVIL